MPDYAIPDHALGGLVMISRRNFFLGGAIATLVPSAVADAMESRSAIGNRMGFNDSLMRRARAALDRHGPRVALRDRIGVVDFSLPSHQPRFHIVDMASGFRETLWVAHGRGSDPDHSGWVERFSNAPGSLASSAGAYLTGETYVGKHGRSRRLIGLEDSNDNAESRAIVIHGAWYVSPDIVARTGKLGRSEGCLAVAESQIELVLERLGPGRLIYVDKV